MSQFDNQNVHSRHPTMALSPAVIKFTQDSIAMCFQNGKELNKTCEEIVDGYIDISSFPMLKVFFLDNGCYSQDNRRLYVFRVLKVLGLLDEVKVRVVRFKSFDKVTTENHGCHVMVRNRPNENGGWIRGPTYRHCYCAKGKKKMLPEWWDTRKKAFAQSRASRSLSHYYLNHFQNVQTPSHQPLSDVKWNKKLFPSESTSNHFKNLQTTSRQLNSNVTWNKRSIYPESTSYGSGHSWRSVTSESKRSDEPQISYTIRQTNRDGQNTNFFAIIICMLIVAFFAAIILDSRK